MPYYEKELDWDHFEIYAYINGNLMTLEGAYERKFISELQLRAILDYHNDM